MGASAAQAAPTTTHCKAGPWSQYVGNVQARGPKKIAGPLGEFWNGDPCFVAGNLAGNVAMVPGYPSRYHLCMPTQGCVGGWWRVKWATVYTGPTPQSFVVGTATQGRLRVRFTDLAFVQ